MCALEKKADVISSCHIFTQYPQEEFTFTWRVTNFSMIFNNVSAQFSTASNATIWMVKLIKQSRIELWRFLEGEPVDVNYSCSLFTSGGTMQTEGHHFFDRISNNCTIMDLKYRYDPLFKDDIMNFQCTLTILGHSVTNSTKSVDVALLNSKQLSCDLKDLFDRQEHCDLTLSVADEKIKAHKAILCARSPVFDKMFQYSMLERDNKQVAINDIDFDVLRDFLSFLYSGKLGELCWDRAVKLYYAADKYEVTGLRDACSQFLECHLEIDNVCYVLKLADMHKDSKLKTTAIFYIQTHSFLIKSTEDWQELLQTHPNLAAEVLK